MSFERAQARSGSPGAAMTDATMATPGKQTQVQLAEANLAQAAGHAAPSLAAVRDGHAVLKIGEHGSAVSHVQRLLHRDPTGDFDDSLRFAVETFQHKHHLATTGTVNDKTLAKLEHAHHHSSGGGGGGGGGVIGGGGGHQRRGGRVSRQRRLPRRPAARCSTGARRAVVRGEEVVPRLVSLAKPCVEHR
jgi:peptidoglycan hydrolase-like protein with peptidoglycan-binding domain